jgi:DNA helicase-2/ATP-dependent DNA helicase PcrA
MNFTEAQLEAINHKYGNLKIIACAGSGKTTVMSERIAKLVHDGEDRNKIVAFTYTEKAASSLKFNVREALSRWCPDSPYLGGMYIGTIHSFAFQKLREIVAKYRSYEVLDEVKRIIWVAKNYSQLGINSIKMDNGYFDSIERFSKTADMIRDNEISLQQIASIPAYKQVHERYLELLNEDKYLDFSGILYELVGTIESSPALLNELRESINFLVVDEYQDVNHIQEKLISLICGHNGNLCVVGDDDQSIFEFQGADVNNIIDFEQRYGVNNTKIVRIQENFRCPREVIEAARDLIRRNSHRIDKSMIPGQSDGKIKTSERGDVYKLEFNTIGEEVSFIVRKIQELRGCEFEDEGINRGLDYGDMAIIVRTRRSAQRLIGPLRRAGIRFTFRGTGGLFQRPEINFIRHIFCFFAEHSADSHLPPVGMHDLETLFNTLGLVHLNWHDLSGRLNELKEYIRSIGTGNADSTKRRIFLQEFYYQIMEALGVNENDFDEDILYDFGRLSKLIAQFESVHGWIDYYYFQQFVIFVNGYAHTRTDEGRLDDPRNTNSVNIITVHQAKGLEFPVVFIPDLSTRRFPSQNRNRLPATHLNNSIFNLQRYCSGDEGERRLFYVACTRTKKFLFVTRSRQSDTGNVATRSAYYTEFDHEIMLRDNVADPTHRNLVAPRAKPNMELMPTSFSDLRHYIDCPYRYLLQQMMGFSPILELAYGYGLQVHNFLNILHKQWQNEPPPIEEVEALVESEFYLRFTRGTPYENMKAKAKSILKTYVEEYGHEFPLKLETEKPFELILGGALISGTIDLIQKLDPVSKEVKDVCILDYKTEKETLETKEAIRLQLRLYALAGDKSLGLNPQKADVHYLTNNFRQEIDVCKEKLEEAKQTITSVIEKIKTGEFPCSKGNCKSCDVRYVCKAR